MRKRKLREALVVGSTGSFQSKANNGVRFIDNSYSQFNDEVDTDCPNGTCEVPETICIPGEYRDVLLDIIDVCRIAIDPEIQDGDEYFTELGELASEIESIITEK